MWNLAPSPRGSAMSAHSVLFNAIVRHFTKAFGDPHRIVNGDCNWSLGRFAAPSSVNVLVNDGRGKPVVWVFDPHDPTNGVCHHELTGEAQIAPLVADIEDRLGKVETPPA
jgi:hypothetical protein